MRPAFQMMYYLVWPSHAAQALCVYPDGRRLTRTSEALVTTLRLLFTRSFYSGKRAITLTAPVRAPCHRLITCEVPLFLVMPCNLPCAAPLDLSPQGRCCLRTPAEVVDGIQKMREGL